MLLTAGCAVTNKAEVPPKPGPQIKSGLKAVMPEVIDKRAWPTEASGTASPNVHIFTQQLTAELKRDLIKSGLFAALPAPDQPGAKGLSDEVKVNLNTFTLEVTGTNAWALPAYLIDGLILPVFAVANLGTAGQMDTGAYLLPSSVVGISMNADVAWYENGVKKPALKRGYEAKVELGAVSEMDLRQNLSDKKGFGVKVGKAEGPKAVEKLVQEISRDPHWLYIDSYKAMARAEQVIRAEDSTTQDRLKAALTLVPLLRPIAYSPDEVKNLRDSALTPGARADMVNEIRARYLGLSGADALPAAQRVSEAQAKKLYDDPAVERAGVQCEIANKVLSLCLMAMSPPQPVEKEKKPKEMVVKAPARVGPPVIPLSPPSPKAPKAEEAGKAKQAPLSPADMRLATQLRLALTKALKGHPRLQVILLSVVDRAVGSAWPPAKALLAGLADSPQVKTYLAKRG